MCWPCHAGWDFEAEKDEDGRSATIIVVIVVIVVVIIISRSSSSSRSDISGPVPAEIFNLTQLEYT